MQLVVLAAGLGSRFGGLKQMTPVDDYGNLMIDYALFDAKKAGINRVVFIIRRELEKDFRELIGNRVEKHMEVRFAFQEVDMLPEDFILPKGRTKPWGTAHALYCARNEIDSDFVIINADDYYGFNAYKVAYGFLQQKNQNHAMVGYTLGKTLTENGHVARGVCKVEDGKLIEIIERTHIEKTKTGARFTEDGENFTSITPDTLVSMNFFAFRHSILNETENYFINFLKTEMLSNPLKNECYLPKLANTLLEQNKITMNMLSPNETWYGVTYSNDMPTVKMALENKTKEGLYPKGLWK